MTCVSKKHDIKFGLYLSSEEYFDRLLSEDRRSSQSRFILNLLLLFIVWKF